MQLQAAAAYIQQPSQIKADILYCYTMHAPQYSSTIHQYISLLVQFSDALCHGAVVQCEDILHRYYSHSLYLCVTLTVRSP